MQESAPSHSSVRLHLLWPNPLAPPARDSPCDREEQRRQQGSGGHELSFQPHYTVKVSCGGERTLPERRCPDGKHDRRTKDHNERVGDADRHHARK
jgi:hypothetical protein